VITQQNGERRRIWIDIAEDRERFEKILHSSGIAQPPNGIASSYEDALVVARRIGYPGTSQLCVGGSAMKLSIRMRS